ncbi:YbaB/EbfC family nucleoid-associated protein [Glycomyces algeriensis]|nr:YbaB/EbfC family nucleoid-associated protein [Glycomyces algeriensis]MDA1365309.1 YbaB/EbfC family nucleoid-associated protein [Glycomyces algeriensis]
MLDPEGSRERLAAWQGRIDRLAEDTKLMSDRLEALRVTVADSNGLVTVTVDSTGNLVDMVFSERIKRQSPEVVSRTAMETIREAKQQVAERSSAIIEATLGSDSLAGRAIAERVRGRLEPGDGATGRS